MRVKSNHNLQLASDNDILPSGADTIYESNKEEQKSTTIAIPSRSPLYRSVLSERIEKYGLYERSVPNDGNCQFTSVSEQLFGCIKYHKSLRNITVAWLRENGEIKMENGTKISDFIDTDIHKNWDEYCDKMEQDHQWGDHITLIALSNIFSRSIIIISSVFCNDDTSYITCINPKSKNYYNREPLFLSHQHEYHYGSLRWKN